MLAPLNSTMIAVALPGIIEDFEVTIGSAGWLVTAYLIAMASLQPLAGKLGDVVGRRPLIIGGLVMFGLVSIGAGFAPTLPVLLVLRVLQGVAGALIIPNCIAVLRHTLPEHRRGAGFGLVGAGIALAAAGGPPLGGVLVEAAGWRSIFFINLLLVVPAGLMAWRLIPRMQVSRSDGPFDILGAISLPALLIALAWILISFSRGAGVLTLAVGMPTLLFAGVAFVWYEFRQFDPIVQPRFFQVRAFGSAALSVGLGNLAMYSLLVAIPILLALRSDSPLRIGLILTAMSAGMAFTSFAGGRLIDRMGRRMPTISGLALMTFGIAPIAFAGSDVTILQLVPSLALVGLGLGLASPGLQTSAVESVDRTQAGSASGLFSTSRYLGSIIGSAVIAGVLDADRAGAEGMGTVFLLAFIAAALATLAGVGLRGRPALIQQGRID